MSINSCMLRRVNIYDSHADSHAVIVLEHAHTCTLYVIYARLLPSGVVKKN